MKKYSIIVVFLCIAASSINANDRPYFIGSPEVFESKILMQQKFAYSLTDEMVTIDSTILDSSFSCEGNSCVWNYIYSFDTIHRANFNFVKQDSFVFVDTLVFSFFDSENDSCRFSVKLLDRSGTMILPDSIWGTTAARASMGNRIFFSSRIPVAGSRRYILAMNQLENSTDTVFDTITDPSRVSLDDRVATDSVFIQRINGKWRFLYHNFGSYSGITGIYSRSKTDESLRAVAVDTQFFFYRQDTQINKASISLKDRIGWQLPTYCDVISGYLLLGDTLVTTLNT